MVKKPLPTVFVQRAALVSRELTRMKSRGPGDIPNAMRQLEREYGLDYWLLWRLRYTISRIKDVPASAFARLEAAYRAECERQQRRLAHEIQIAEKLTGFDLDAREPVVGDAQVSPRLPPPVAGKGEEG